eukprot:1180616-Prorocentrum_minimum.AAC.3
MKSIFSSRKTLGEVAFAACARPQRTDLHDKNLVRLTYERLGARDGPFSSSAIPCRPPRRNKNWRETLIPRTRPRETERRPRGGGGGGARDNSGLTAAWSPTWRRRSARQRGCGWRAAAASASCVGPDSGGRSPSGLSSRMLRRAGLALTTPARLASRRAASLTSTPSGSDCPPPKGDDK